MNKNGALYTAGSFNNRWRRPRGMAIPPSTITSQKMCINSSMSKMYLSWAKCERHNNKGRGIQVPWPFPIMLYYEDLTSFLFLRLLVILLELIIFDYESKNWLLPRLPANFELTRRCEEEIFLSLRVIVLPFYSTFKNIHTMESTQHESLCPWNENKKSQESSPWMSVLLDSP